MTWTGRCGTSSSRGRVSGRAGGSGSRGSRSAGSAGTRSGSDGRDALLGHDGHLPRLGTIRTHESTRKLARRLENGTARILSATVSRTAQRWFVSFTVEVERAIPERHARPGSAVGVDLGVKTLLTGVDDVGRGGHGRRAEAAPRRRCGGCARASRAHSRKATGSANRRKSAARLARIHARVANVRADALHKATTTLAARYETVVAEDLNVAGMIRNRKLARADLGSGIRAGAADARLQDHLERRQLVPADRWFPQSKTCSGCGAVKAKLTLADRVYVCESCGLVMDRDVNAARNLLDLAASGAERLNACGGTVRPGLAGHAR